MWCFHLIGKSQNGHATAFETKSLHLFSVHSEYKQAYKRTDDLQPGSQGMDFFGFDAISAYTFTLFLLENLPKKQDILVESLKYPI